MYQVKLNQTTRPLVFLMVDSSDHISPKVSLSPTVLISKNGGSFVSPAGAVSEIGNGWYQIAGNSTDAGALGPLIVHASASGADPTDVVFRVVSFDPDDAVSMGLTNLDVLVSSRLSTSDLTATAYAEPTSVPGATATIVTMLHWLYTISRNKITQTATTQTLRNDSDAANIGTSSVTDDGTTFTRGKWG